MEIRIQGLSKNYSSEGKTIAALDHVDLTIPANRIFTLLGPSGCGKTTLLRCIVGLETPDSGEIAIGDEVVLSKEKNISIPPEKRGLGMVFQTYAIWPHMNVFDNVAYPLQTRNVPRDVIRAEGGEDAPTSSSSKASKTGRRRSCQRGSAAAGRPGPGPGRRAQGDPLRRTPQQPGRQAPGGDAQGAADAFSGSSKITAVYVTHDRIEALSLSDTVAVMRSGRIVEMGTPREIYFDSDRRFVADFIGRANLVKATVRAQEGDHTIVDCGLGTIACQRRDIPAGSEVTLCIRPEFIRIARGEGGGKNVVNGRVETLIFVGEAYEVEIRVGNELLLAKIDPDVNLREGSAVNFSLDPEHCLLLSI